MGDRALRIRRQTSERNRRADDWPLSTSDLAHDGERTDNQAGSRVREVAVRSREDVSTAPASASNAGHTLASIPILPRVESAAGPAGGPLSPETAAQIEAARENGTALDAGTRDVMEGAFGTSFTGVHIHADGEADALNGAVGARAFTTGSDIFFRQGTFQPSSSAGRELLAHELTHVVQQQGIPSGASLTVGPAEDAYEQEADRAGAAVERMIDSGAAPSQRIGTSRRLQRQVQSEGEDPAVAALDLAPTAEETIPAGSVFNMTLPGSDQSEGWDVDPDGLLADSALNPDFKSAAQVALKSATQDGLRPRVHEAYRSAERSDELYQKYKAGTGGRAAPGWTSLHNYGLAMDVYLYDAKGKWINTEAKGWYKEYKKLSRHMKAHKLEWGEPINDADHFEFHPAWSGLAGGELLKTTRDWALKTAKDANTPDWLQYFWWKAGAGGTAPAAAARPDK
jgi:hypothetical protein